MVLYNLTKDEAILLGQMMVEDPVFDDEETQKIFESLKEKIDKGYAEACKKEGVS